MRYLLTREGDYGGEHVIGAFTTVEDAEKELPHPVQWLEPKPNHLLYTPRGLSLLRYTDTYFETRLWEINAQA